MNDKLFNIFNRKSFTSGKKSGGSAVVSVEVEARTPITKLLANLGDPVQDLHGYANPWPGGGGKNKFLTTLETNTKNQVTATVDSDGFIHLSGTANATTIFQLGRYTFAPGTYFITMCPPGGSTSTYRVYASFGSNDTGNGLTRTFTQETEITFQMNINSGTNTDGLVFKPMICLSSEGTDFAPYANICPISGFTGLSVYVSPTQDPDDATVYNVDWSTQAGTVYGGTVDVVTGVLTVDRANIASYNGETITEPWLSSMDAYAAGTTPTTGAQVVYTLATPVEYHVGRIPMYLMPGINYVWLSDGLLIDEFEYYEFPEGGVVCDAYIDGDSMQADGWFVKWRRLSAPQPKTDYTSVYGRDGSIDLTEESGDVFYEDRTVNLDMVYIGEDWNDAYSKLLNAIHGQKCAVQFTDDPYWYWAARLVASDFEHKTHSLTMNGVAFPYKLSIFENSYQASVNGAVEGTATELQLEGSRMRVSPQVVVTGEVTLKWGTKTATLSAGTYYVRGLKVGPEGVTLKVWGTGTVAITYREGSL